MKYPIVFQIKGIKSNGINKYSFKIVEVA